MDLRRSAFREKWHFGDGADTAATVEWYECPPDAKWYTEVTPYRSLDTWDRISPLSGPGPDVPQTPVWIDGATIPLYTGQGPPCGVEWFATGIPSPPPATPARNPDGVPVCCTVHHFGAWAGDATSRGAWVSTPPPDPFFRQKSAFNSLEPTRWPPSWTLPTLNDSCLLFVVGVYSSTGSDPVLVIDPGWQKLQSFSLPFYSQYWYFYPNAPAGVALPEVLSLPSPWVGDLIAYEIVGLLGTHRVDALGINGSNTDRVSLGPLGTSASREIGVAVYYSVDPPVTVGFPSGWQGPFQELAFWLYLYDTYQVFNGPVGLSFSELMPRAYAEIVGAVTFPQLPISGSCFWIGGAITAAAWRSDLLFLARWTGSASGASSWVAVGTVSSRWAGSAVAASSWVGAGIVTASWSGSATGHSAWVAAAGALCHWSGTATGSASWATLAIGSCSWSGSATGGSSWVGASKVFKRRQTASASGLSTSVSLSWAGGTTAGDLLTVVAGATAASGGLSTPTVSAPAGWTLLDHRNAPVLGVGCYIAMFYKTAAGGTGDNGSFTIGSGDGICLYGEAWQGANVTPTTGGTNFATNNTPSAPNLALVGSVMGGVGGMLSRTQTFSSESLVGYDTSTRVSAGSGSGSVNLDYADGLSNAALWSFSAALAAAARWVSISAVVKPA
jgi:hypothetical protein